MRTEIRGTHPEVFSESLALALKCLSEDQPIGLPTETVYGLAANALSETAISRIFEAKGRPSHARSRRNGCRTATCDTVCNTSRDIGTDTESRTVDSRSSIVAIRSTLGEAVLNAMLTPCFNH